MIFDDIKNSFLYENEKLKKGFDFIKNTDLSSLKEGRYEIDGDKIFANVQSLKTKSKEEKIFEAHRKYIDIQYLIKGKECMAFGLLKNFKKEAVAYDNNKDVVFLEGSDFNYINLDEGEFTVFYPDDVHAPMLSVDEANDIKKVIVKIQI